MVNPDDRHEARVRRRKIRAISTGVVLAGLALIAYIAAPAGSDADRSKARDRAEAACGAEAPADPEPRRYDAPEEVLEDGVDYGAVITTSCGTISVDLLEDAAPRNVNNFVFLASEGFYDGLQWFRVERNSVIQAGDPNDDLSEPPNGPGYTIEDELPERSNEYVFGAVAMANEGPPDTAGSQFFIVIHENRPAGYQAAYSIFGRVDEGSYEVLREIGKQRVRGGREPIEAVRPVTPVYVEKIEIDLGVGVV